MLPYECSVGTPDNNINNYLKINLTHQEEPQTNSVEPHMEHEDLPWLDDAKFEWDDDPVMSYSATKLKKEEFEILLDPENFNKEDEVAYVFMAYKCVANKIKPCPQHSQRKCMLGIKFSQAH